MRGGTDNKLTFIIGVCMAINFGGIVGNLLGGVDLTPGFNFDAHAGGGIPFISKGNGSTGIAAQSVVPKTNAVVKDYPASQDSTPQTIVPYSNSGSSSGSSRSSAASTTSVDPQAAAYYNDQINQTNSQLGNLDPLQNQLLANVDNSYNNGIKSLNDQNAIAQRNYDTSRTNTISDNEQAKQNIDSQVRSNTNALQRLLGLAGSGNSSAADYANYAAARQGTVQRQQVQNSYGKNLQALDTNWGDTQNQYNTGINSLQDQREQNRNSVLQKVNDNRSSLLQALANLKIQQGQAAGQNYTTAAASASPYVQQVQALQAQQGALSRDYANPVLNTNGVAFTAPDLASYDTTSQAVAPTTDANGVNDTVNPIYANLLKKDANGNIIA